MSSETLRMARYGFKLIIGGFLARSVRGVPCSPPVWQKKPGVTHN
ncbi:hypothetical protein SJI00_13105 [Pseudomonas sp. RP23018S]|nr:hypothetical protein [Pseudomonas sp. RP23018S]MDZ5603714.1 hypothetical protein [Pseudomonas sp. RP23018S]